jgi:hypothetical protein
MDHAINALQPFLEYEIDSICEELDTGKYGKLSECPSYPAAKALVDAIHRLERYYYGKSKSSSVRDEVNWRKELAQCNR